MGLLCFLLILLIAGGLAIVGYLYYTGRLTPLKPRPPGTDGSAHWAYDVAVSTAHSELDTDAVVVEIIGTDVLPDGRLAANRGMWTLQFSSFTAAQRVAISVDHDRNISVGSTTTPGIIRALGSPPGNFPDSITIYAETIGHGATGTRERVNPVECKYDSVSGSHIWMIPMKVGSIKETHIVRWDGIWLELR